MLKQSSDRCKLAFSKLCLGIGSPYALEALALFNESEQKFATSLQMPDPRLYDDAEQFGPDYAAYNYLRKYVGLQTKIDRKAVALEKWKTVEERNATTNRLLKSGSYLTYEVESAILRARHKVARVLGSFEFSKVMKSCGMGPGSTFDVSRKAKPGTKYSLPITTTPECASYAKAWLEQDIHFAFSSDRGLMPVGPYSLLPQSLTIVAGNRMSFVDKDSTVDRVISIEPTFPLFLQKGVGAFIRKRLKKFGIDLDSQSGNQELARNAQRLGLATIDLSSASDSICAELVKLLLPLDWWLYLDRIRSKKTFIKNEGFVNLHKWSSMGNGFTFELESLIFWALAPESEFATSVYGDDIVCKQDCADEYIKILEGVGFSINKQKSFVDGRFFESCGKHFFDGIEVTPCYQKEIVSTASAYVRAFNRLFLLGDRTAIPLYEDVAIVAYFEAYPYENKPFVPHFADDRGFKTYDMSPFKYDRNRGYRCPVLKVPRIKKRVHFAGLLAKKMQNPNQAIFDPTGRYIYEAGLERNAKLSYSWIQPFVLANKWRPLGKNASTSFEDPLEP